MSNVLTTNKLVVSGAVLAWVVPMLVSFFMIDPETQAYLPNEMVFKGTMILLSAIVSFYFFRKISTGGGMSFAVPTTFLGINVLFDVVVLIGVFAMPVVEWATTVLPAYVIIFYGLYFLLKK